MNTTLAYKVATSAVVCIDVARFTALTTRLGDEVALQVMHRTARITARVVRLFGGRAWEARGDGALFTFPTADAAVVASCAVHRLVERDRLLVRHQLALRTAIHVGPLCELADRIFGLNVILAFRLCDLAMPGQIVVSAEVLANLPAQRAQLCDAEAETHLKGIEHPVRFARLVPDPTSASSPEVSPRHHGPVPLRLRSATEKPSNGITDQEFDHQEELRA
ncbi:MAG: adenylate/guanylate cyclase domain-containing protein [Gammaproteobacteria bacterium]|jgi:class 3 adenylate cyclase|nr:adenylate/guanylate cyclase domain-containing protein [Gammaproteobacteria bacterium]